MVYTKRARVRLGPQLNSQNRRFLRPSRLIAAGFTVLLLAAGLYATSVWRHTATPGTMSVPSTPEVLGAQKQADGVSSNGFYIYTAQGNDTLFSISEKFQVNWEMIITLNSLTSPFAITAGQQIKLPANAATKQQQYYDNLKNKLYAVQSGDTFVSIAQKLDLSVNDLLRVNPQLTTVSIIRPGQVLHLP